MYLEERPNVDLSSFCTSVEMTSARGYERASALLRLAELLAREDAWEPAAEPGLEPVFLARAEPVGEGPGA